MNAFYVIAAGISWGCILTVLLFDIIFGLRARFRVKKERVTALPKGFSPLDYQRIMKGKTRPERMTRALLVWWAQKGYIKIGQLKDNVVRVWKLKNMPPHHKAEFYDRGTYVREHKIFNHIFSDVALETGFKDINITVPLLSRKSAQAINKSFAIGENEGVFGTGHFILKIVTQVLCFVPYFLACAWAAYSTDDGMLYVGLSIFSVIGVLALKYMIVVPPAIRYPFFSLWGGMPYIGVVTAYLSNVHDDPWYFGLAALLFYALGTFIFILFADYREKENLKEYSDVYNFKKYLLFVPKKAVDRGEYYEILPMLYAMNLTILKGKFRSEELPPWYSGKKGGGLI
ncbi:MAG: hypothetical protein K2L02_04450 [Clostridia bacterium]|nr:hypothetical protein [Clostridia bacterium]